MLNIYNLGAFCYESCTHRRTHRHTHRHTHTHTHTHTNTHKQYTHKHTHINERARRRETAVLYILFITLNFYFICCIELIFHYERETENMRDNVRERERLSCLYRQKKKGFHQAVHKPRRRNHLNCFYQQRVPTKICRKWSCNLLEPKKEKRRRNRQLYAE